MSEKTYSQAQDNIIDGLNADDWEMVVDEFGGKTVEEIKAELDHMFWSDVDINGDFAQEIFDALNS